MLAAEQTKNGRKAGSSLKLGMTARKARARTKAEADADSLRE
jgi:hypothetical protein